MAVFAETKGVRLNWTTDSDSARQNTPGLASGTSSISLIYFFAGDYDVRLVLGVNS